ncbi:lipid transporter ATP-binding/permease protein [Pluralibacter gergoviae]|nr:lipid transporter ATP-binding/permease protein [Pluralibacter gergoviae]
MKRLSVNSAEDSPAGRSSACLSPARSPQTMAEATSALDADSERCVNQAIRQLRIIRIIIAHRESTIATVDKMLSRNVAT